MPDVSRQLFPPLETVAVTLVRLTVSGVLPHHAMETLLRLAAGFAIAAFFRGGRRARDGTLTPGRGLSAAAGQHPRAVPGLAYTPLFLLWFGPGNPSTVLLVGFVSSFAVIYNTWTGVKAVKEIWLRSARAMGASDPRVFRHVILPGALPYILTGLRLGLAQAWRVLVAIEMLASVPWGLGWMIFGAQQFLATDVMLAGVFVIAVIGSFWKSWCSGASKTSLSSAGE